MLANAVITAMEIDTHTDTHRHICTLHVHES